MHSEKAGEMSPEKLAIIEKFRDHVSSGKAAFYRELNMVFVPARIRTGP